MSQDHRVITGYNTDIKHNDRVFHVQTEDKGVVNPIIESLIYMGGKIIASRQLSYTPLLRQGYTEKAVQDLLDSQHRRMVRDIRGGKYDPDGPPAFGAGIITDRSFDEVVLEFIRGQAGSEKIELVVKGSPAPRPGDLMVLELAVRGELRNAPVPGAEVLVRAVPPGGARTVTLFEGFTDEAGCIKAGFEVPRDFDGGTLSIAARSPLGSDEAILEVSGA